MVKHTEQPDLFRVTLKTSHQQMTYSFNQVIAEGPALLLVHGAGGTIQEWPAELRTLPNFPVYALNLPGHGGSDRPGRTTIEAYADVVWDFIATLGLKRVVIGGHSMGGAIAQILGWRRPPGLEGLVLVGTGARLRVTDLILEGLLTDFEATVTFIVNHSWSPEAHEALTTAHRQRLLQNDPVIMQADFAACHAFDMMDRLAQLDTPTLVLGGAADKMTPPKYSRFLADHLPQAQLVILENAGHMLALEQPDKTVEAIVPFMELL